ncbi:MAG: hypothetical protein ACREFB_03240 [Stellaceae bacterium]
MTRWFAQWPLALVIILGASVPAAAGDLALKRVVLSNGGVGYFEYEAAVDGDATLSLSVGLDQVDDVLKSLMVYDSAGSAGEITLPGREPLTQSLADLPFDRAALGSLTALLDALQGAEIRVTGPTPITGRLVHVEPETTRLPDGSTRTRARVGVLTDKGLQQFVLDDAESIAFIDPVLQGQVKEALRRIAAYRDTGRRTLTLSVHGKGHRIVRVGYVVAMPVWKTSYRLSLPADPHAATARMQGWAVLENFSGQAWKDVDLTLVSGNPVTFRQNLYESYYVPRPVVPIEAGGRVLPPADTGALGPAAEAERAPPSRMRMFRAPMHAGAPTMAAPMPAAPPPAPIEAAAASEGATQIAFSLPAKVTVGVGQSLVLPLLDRDLPARRLDLYQPSVDATHPLAAIELTNAADTGLPPGVLTIYQQGDRGALYLGDARLGAVPAGDKRMLSFAVDSKVTIDRSDAETRHIVKATIAQGMLRVDRSLVATTTYRVKAASAPPLLLIEQPRQSGWTLAAPDPHSVEETATAYRIPVTLGPDGRATLAVALQRPQQETIGLTDLSDQRIAVFVSSSELDPKLRQALTGIAGRRQSAARQQATHDRLQAQRKQLIDDEARYRGNLTALPQGAALRRTELDKLTAAEAEIDRLSASIAATDKKLAETQDALGAYIAGLNL